MIIHPSYNPRKNLIQGLFAFLNYEGSHPIIIILQSEFFAGWLFDYHLFTFLFQSVGSIIFATIIFVLIIVIPAAVVAMVKLKQRIDSEKLNLRLLLWIIVYIYLITLIIFSEYLYFSIHFSGMMVNSFEMKLSPEGEAWLNLGLVIGLGIIPYWEPIYFHHGEIKNWICSRDEYIIQTEALMGNRFD